MGFGAFVSSLFALNSEGQDNDNMSQAQEIIEEKDTISQNAMTEEEKKIGTRMQFAMREARRIERSIYGLISADKSLVVPYEETFHGTDRVYKDEEVEEIEKSGEFRKIIQFFADREQAMVYLFVDVRPDGVKRIYVQFKFGESDVEVGQFSSDMPVNSSEALKCYEAGEVVFGKINTKIIRQ